MALTRGRLVKGGIAALAALTIGGGAAAVAQAQAAPGAGVFGPRFGRGPAMMGQGAAPGVGFGPGGVASDALLKKLGLTAEQLLTERHAGKSLAQIAQSKGVDKATLIALLGDEHKATLDAAVKAGRMTQAQADAALATMKQRIEAEVDRTEVGPPAWAGPANGGFGLGMGPGGAGAAARGRMPRFGGRFGGVPAPAPGATPGAGYGPPWTRGTQS